MSHSQSTLHVISRLDGYAAAQQLRILAASQIDAGHLVRVAALRAQDSIFQAWTSEGIACCDLQSRWRFDPFAVWRLSSLLSDEQPDVVHVWDSDASATLGIAALRYAKPRRIATLLAPPPTFVRHLRGMDGYALASEFLAHDYAERGINGANTAIVRPGIGRSEVRYSKQQFRQDLELAEDAQLIVTVGPLVRSKRLDEAIWHFELVRTLNERAALLVLGDGPDRWRLERYARLVSEPQVIKFLGYCDDIPAYLSLADVVWHTGEENAISFAVLESMAAAVPVVASDVPMNRSLIEQGETGFLAAAGSRAMFARYTLRLLENPELAQRIGEAAAAQVRQRFSTESMIAGYRELYGAIS